MIGYLAAFLTTVSFLPDAIHVVRTKDVEDISLPMYSLFVAGVFLWFVYGLATGQASLYVANGITLALSGVTLCYKVREDLRAR